jgi:hypothetical protein
LNLHAGALSAPFVGRLGAHDTWSRARMIWPLEALREGNWTVVNLWIVAGVFALAALWAVVDWMISGWISNVLRNYLDAKRRMRRNSADR